MSNWWHGTKRKLGQILRVVLLFAIVRTIFGLAMIVLFNRDAVAWGPEITLLSVVAVAVCLGAALAVRRWSPPHRA